MCSYKSDLQAERKRHNRQLTKLFLGQARCLTRVCIASLFPSLCVCVVASLYTSFVPYACMHLAWLWASERSLRNGVSFLIGLVLLRLSLAAMLSSKNRTSGCVGLVVLSSKNLSNIWFQ